MLAAYGRETLLDQAYVSGAIFYGRYNVATQRVVTISSDDILRGHFVANNFGGQLEGGYNFALDDSSALTPYAGFVGQDFKAPAYSETVLSGNPTFALSYAAEESGFVHSDIGARLSHDFEAASDTTTTELHAAWTHQLQDDVLSRAGIESVAGSSFVVTGAAMPLDSLSLGAGLQIKSQTGMSGGARIESQFGAGFTAVSGTVNIGYSW